MPMVTGFLITVKFESSRARCLKWSRGLVNTGFRDYFFRGEIVSPRVFPHYSAFLNASMTLSAQQGCI